MKRASLLAFAALLWLSTAIRAENVTVGGAVMPVAQGWTQSVIDGNVTLSPPGLGQGVACTLTLLGGESFTGGGGSLKDRMTTEWKDFEALGKVVTDDGAKITGEGGPVVSAGRWAKIQTTNGVSVYVWLMLVTANGRIERMVFVTNTPDAFTQYAPAVSTMINGTQWIAPKAVAATPKPSGVSAGVSQGSSGDITGGTSGGPGANPAAVGAKAFGHVTYVTPPGWRETRADGQVVLSPPSLPANESLEVLLMPAAPAAGTLADALTRAWNEAAALSRFKTTRSVNNTAFNVTQEERVSFKGWPYIRGEGIMTAADGHDYYIALTVLKINNRFERVLVRSRQNEVNFSRYSQYQNPDYLAAFQQFLFTLQFDDWKDPKLQPGTLKGDGIIGAWWGVSMFGGRLHTAATLFFSNGQVFFGSRFPLRGCYELNTWLDAEETPRYWGTYDYKNGKGTLKMPYGEIPIAATGKDLLFTTNNSPHTFVRLPAIDGIHLAGTFAFPEYLGKIPALVFTADGRFEDKGALSQLRIETSYPFSPALQNGGGTYVIKDYTLLFNYADGRKYRIAFPGNGYDPKNPSPALLPLGYSDQELKKQ